MARMELTPEEVDLIETHRRRMLFQRGAEAAREMAAALVRARITTTAPEVPSDLDLERAAIATAIITMPLPRRS